MNLRPCCRSRSKTCRLSRSRATQRGICQREANATARRLASVIYRNNITYQRIQQPHASPEVEDLDGIEQDSNRHAGQYNRVPVIHNVTTDLLEIQIHKQPEEE